ncbi:MAG: hypothetical protein OEW88_02225 [Gammaproteobacteria bacterium]|nr:hypothetical protein [Gammaproteobacteria bacterium]
MRPAGETLRRGYWLRPTVYGDATIRHLAGTPVGGWKNSGPGREQCLQELLDYAQEKAIYVFV